MNLQGLILGIIAILLVLTIGINANGQMSIFTDVDKLDQETLF